MDEMVIDDLTRGDRISALGTTWRVVTDQVMGGVSQATLSVERHDERQCLCLRGEVRLENSGGFVQMTLDLNSEMRSFDATGFDGVRLVISGNAERYYMRLRTADVARPWQSYRAHFDAPGEWTEIHLPFEAFVAHRIEAPLDRGSLQRIGLGAIGRAYTAELRLAEIALYRS